MIHPMSLRIESHPSGGILDVICDVNSPDPIRVSLTRDLALILRHELDRALTKDNANA